MTDHMQVVSLTMDDQNWLSHKYAMTPFMTAQQTMQLVIVR